MTATAVPKLITVDEFWDFVHLPENEGKIWELDNGRIVEMPSPGFRHGVVCTNIGRLLTNYAYAQGRGVVACNDTGLIVRRNPDTVRGPDVMYFDATMTFDDLSPKFAEDVPAVVVEVLSPSDSAGRVMRRVDQYRKRGVRLIWAIDPDERTVSVYKPGEFPVVLDEGDELTGNGVLPDFQCRVADLFAMPGQQTNAIPPQGQP